MIASPVVVWSSMQTTLVPIFVGAYILVWVPIFTKSLPTEMGAYIRGVPTFIGCQFYGMSEVIHIPVLKLPSPFSPSPSPSPSPSTSLLLSLPPSLSLPPHFLKVSRPVSGTDICIACIVGGIVGGIVFLLILATIITLIIVAIYYKHSHPKTQVKDGDTVALKG